MIRAEASTPRPGDLTVAARSILSIVCGLTTSVRKLDAPGLTVSSTSRTPARRMRRQGAVEEAPARPDG
jgi:hypothetical protein